MHRFVPATLAVAAVFAAGAFAGDPAPSSPPPRAEAASWEGFSRRFDLDTDGRVTWDEYQKVVSGFAALDRDRDGAITQAEFPTVPTALAGLEAGPQPGRTPWASPVWEGMPGTGGTGGPCVGGVCVGGSCKGGACAPMGEMGPWMAVGMLGDALDTDHDQVIARTEWDAFVAKVLPDATAALAPTALRALAPDAIPPGADALWTTLLDRDGNGRIERADLAAVFTAVDTNADGRIDRNDAPPASLKR